MGILEQSGHKMNIDALVDKLQETDDDGIPIIPLKHLMTRQLSTIFSKSPEPADDPNVQGDQSSLFDLIQMGMLLADEDLQNVEDTVSPLAMNRDTATGN